MQRTFTAAEPPEKLKTYLKTHMGAAGMRLRCRAVLNKPANAAWQLMGCAVEAYSSPESTPNSTPSRSYPTAYLYEDWFDLEAAQAFLIAIGAGSVRFGDITIESKAALNWQVEFVPLKNIHMHRAGYVAYTPFGANVAATPGPLVSLAEPYYPNPSEAVRDWLGFADYQGESDMRNRGIVFLLPETRAVFTRARSDNGVLTLTVGGHQPLATALRVKGAYWLGKSIHHFEGEITHGEAALPVPDTIDRLEYVLLDAAGEVYDHQFESWGNHSGLVRERIVNNTDRLAQLVHDAMATGEGAHTEFKPFVEYREGLGASGKKTKYRELVRTLVAFANTQGGAVFLGIDDTCTLDGIGEALKRESAGAPLPEAFEAYRGTLLNKIRGDIIGEVAVQISAVTVDGKLLAIVEAPQARAKPLAVLGENIYYVRVGASNRQLPPSDWAKEFGPANYQVGWPDLH